MTLRTLRSERALMNISMARDAPRGKSQERVAGVFGSRDFFGGSQILSTVTLQAVQASMPSFKSESRLAMIELVS